MLTAMDGDDQAFVLLLLSDGNLPTGSFVASSGLESYLKHGFAASQSDPTTAFLRDSLETYARSALPFVSDAHCVLGQVRQGCGDDQELLGRVLTDLLALDDLYHATTPNHVARRASQAQGVALLTLYAKGFSRPESSGRSKEDHRLYYLIDRLKSSVRRGETHGHLPICWGVLTGALCLSLGKFCSQEWKTKQLILRARTIPVLAFVSACKERFVRIGSSEQYRSVRFTANPTPYRPAISRCRNVAMQASSHRHHFHAGPRRIRRGASWTGNNMASGRNSRNTP